MRWSEVANIEKPAPAIHDHLAWDGQHLWAFDKISVTDDMAARYRNQAGDRTDEGCVLAPLHLVSIDVGLSRKPDTTERHNKALAFERKNGTLKAIPLFEQIIADDPAAAEVRNHLGWALATRPPGTLPRCSAGEAAGRDRPLSGSRGTRRSGTPLAEIYWRLGDAKLAEHLEAKAINLNPSKTFYWRAARQVPEPARPHGRRRNQPTDGTSLLRQGLASLMERFHILPLKRLRRWPLMG